MAASATPPSQGERTRDRVLVAATDLFAERGFPAVTMRAIGAGAGLDNSSLYRHFANKSALAREVLDRAMARLAAEVVPSAAAAEPTREGITRLVVRAALHLWDHPTTARLLLHWLTSARDAATGFDVSLPVDAPGAPSADVFRAFMALLRRAREQGEIRDLAMPDALVAVLGAITLRAATYGDFLASQEPERDAVEARRSWEREVETLLHGMLSP